MKSSSSVRWQLLLSKGKLGFVISPALLDRGLMWYSPRPNGAWDHSNPHNNVPSNWSSCSESAEIPTAPVPYISSSSITPSTTSLTHWSNSQTTECTESTTTSSKPPPYSPTSKTTEWAESSSTHPEPPPYYPTSSTSDHWPEETTSCTESTEVPTIPTTPTTVAPEQPTWPTTAAQTPCSTESWRVPPPPQSSSSHSSSPAPPPPPPPPSSSVWTKPPHPTETDPWSVAVVPPPSSTTTITITSGTTTRFHTSFVECTESTWGPQPSHQSASWSTSVPAPLPTTSWTSTPAPPPPSNTTSHPDAQPTTPSSSVSWTESTITGRRPTPSSRSTQGPEIPQNSMASEKTMSRILVSVALAAIIAWVDVDDDESKRAISPLSLRIEEAGQNKEEYEGVKIGSVGMRQKVVLARSIRKKNPKYYLLIALISL
ncbi:uncharacterized protein MYCFIDRAFT_169661 [Pseudocercospora fijiensis CIRAD86]|uniref:Uncharacterized protein n=1 Tax=Pseudocercospora fijiensis (strain CIRAD86) TaxID=383855 RepID=N1Q6G2_PSEFD|nr:uncharacterized protein MYCFIDRAFT_169661 [Pseudocercospora fijiensis CIRAD86]EME87934.1 hypothetical protein MYCFIDRAFT_169661 [Pseudocercospora fijiensis CIRAD86]